MNTTIKTGLAAILLLTISCKKENNTIRTIPLSDEKYITNIDEAVKYTYVKIGTQKWMTRNLDVSRYRNGDNIPYVKSHSEWATLKTGAWCWYNNDSASYAATYGKLYNWYAVHDRRGLAPAGWHVPSDAEWDTLIMFVEGYAVAGGKLKDTGTIEAGTGLWYKPNKGATNETGFTALPGGWRSSKGIFDDIGRFGFWRTSTENFKDALSRRMVSYESNIYSSVDSKKNGFSVRCVKD